MNRSISLAHLTVIELAPPDVVTVASDAGYDTVDLRLCKAVPEDIEYPMFGDTPMMRDTLRRLDDTGLKVFDVEIIRLRRGLALEKFLPMFEAAARLGAKWVKVSGDDPDEQVVMDLFVRTCELSAPFGLKVDLEFMPWSGISSLEKAARVVTNAGQENGAVLVDTLHLSRSGGKPEDIAAFDPGLFGYVQVCDAPPVPPSDLDEIAHEARVARLIPGEGGLPLAEVLTALPDGLPVSLELPMKDLARRMPAAERARLAIAGVRRVLDSMHSGV